MPISNVTKDLAGFIHSVDYHHLPERVISRSRLALLDWLGCTLASALEPSSQILSHTMLAFAGSPQACILGASGKTDILTAALLNGHASHAVDFDDVHMGWVGHPSAPVWPAVLAVAEWRGHTLADVMTAYIVSVEVESRIGLAVMPTHYARGNHSTGTVGHFGAAAAAARLMGLNVNQTVHALGIAGTQSSGLRVVFGGMCKPFHAGKAAADGIRAALLAEQGFTSCRDVIGGRYGFAETLSDSYDAAVITKGLGENWAVDGIVFKRHASCSETHALIECALALRNTLPPQLGDISAITGQVQDFCLSVANIHSPQSGAESKFCHAYCIATALAKGDTGIGAFTDNRLNDPDIRTLLPLITVTGSPDLHHEQATIEVVLTGGQRIHKAIDLRDQIPTIEQLTTALTTKFLQLLTPLAGEDTAMCLAESCLTLDLMRDLGSFLDKIPVIDKVR